MATEKVRETTADEQTAETTEGEDQPELRHSDRRKHRHRPDAYTVGYDPTGGTRVGIGTGSQQSRLERLIRHNEGRHQSDGKHSSREAARDKKRITQSFCSFLRTTPHQQREAVSVISQLNLDRFGRQKRLEKVALGVIRFVVDRDRQRIVFNGHDPTSLDFSEIDESKFPDPFVEYERYQILCKEHEMSRKDQYSISQLIKRELKRIGYFDQDSGQEDNASSE